MTDFIVHKTVLGKRKRFGGSYDSQTDVDRDYKHLKRQDNVQSRHPVRKPKGDPLVDGISSETTRQNVSTASAWLDRNLYTQRIANSVKTAYDSIPGSVIPGKDHIFDIRPGDPMFVKKSSLMHNGENHPVVFTALNGIGHSQYKSSTEMDDDFKFIGISNSYYSFTSIGTEKVAVTVQTSGSLTVPQNGYQDLKEADNVAYIVPEFQKVWTNNKWVNGPDKNWVDIHSISGKTNRVLPRLMKITPMLLTQQLRDTFWHLYHLVDSKDQRVFPVGDYFMPQIDKNGRDIRKIEKLSCRERHSIAKYTDIIQAALSVIITLIDMKVLDGVGGDALSSVTSGPDYREKYKNLIAKIAFFTGFMETSGIKEYYTTSTGRSNLEKDMKMKNDIMMKILERYFYTFTSPKMKNATVFDLDQKTVDENLINAMTHSTANAVHEQYMHYLEKSNKIVGMVVKGNKVGTQVDIDFRRTIL